MPVYSISILAYVCLLISNFIHECSELIAVVFGLSVLWVFQLSEKKTNSRIITSLLSPSASITSKGVRLGLSSCLCVSTCQCLVSEACLLYALIRPVKTAAKRNHCRTFSSSFVLGCDALCWCNLRSASLVSWPQLLLHQWDFLWLIFNNAFAPLIFEVQCLPYYNLPLCLLYVY